MAAEDKTGLTLRNDETASRGPQRVFVYGTLKRGDCRHHWLAGERFLGDAVTRPLYRLFNVGAYPALLEDRENGRAIRGEVWEVTSQCLAHLDEVEGLDEGLYHRDVIQLATERFGQVQAYFYLQSVEGCPDCGEEWKIS